MPASMTSLRVLSNAPRAHLFTRAPIRSFASCPPSLAGPSSSAFGSFGSSPMPPRLPEEEQKLFEELQKQSTGAFSTPRAKPKINQSPDSTPTDVASAESAIVDRIDKIEDSKTSQFKEDYKKIIEARGKGDELHPNVRRGAAPEFEGDRNPKTGEVGGPKNEPLRWGAAGDWSYNGRTTDF